MRQKGKSTMTNKNFEVVGFADRELTDAGKVIDRALMEYWDILQELKDPEGASEEWKLHFRHLQMAVGAVYLDLVKKD